MNYLKIGIAMLRDGVPLAYGRLGAVVEAEEIGFEWREHRYNDCGPQVERALILRAPKEVLNEVGIEPFEITDNGAAWASSFKYEATAYPDLFRRAAQDLAEKIPGCSERAVREWFAEYSG
jgi:hypothetical protein